jgi:hypothetical protein
LILLAFVSGCANTSGQNFVKAGGGDKTGDVQYCRAYANAQSAFHRKDASFKLCMMDRGYKAQ